MRLATSANGVAWKPATPGEAVDLGQAFRYAKDHVFSRQSVAPEHAFFTAALVKGCGQLDLPELKAVPNRYIHAPWRMPPGEQGACGVLVGRDTPAPLVDHGQARQRTLERYAIVKTS